MRDAADDAVQFDGVDVARRADRLEPSMRLGAKRDPQFLEIEDAIWQLIEEESQRLNMVLAPN